MKRNLDLYEANGKLLKEGKKLYEKICKELDRHPVLYENVGIKYNNCEYIYRDGYVYLVNYDGTEDEFIIPEGVAGILQSAFENNRYLKEIIFPKSLHSIGDDAFSFCSNLEKVKFNSQRCLLGNRIFDHTNLKIIEFSNIPELSTETFSKLKPKKNYWFKNQPWSPPQDEGVVIFGIPFKKYNENMTVESLIEDLQYKELQQKGISPLLLKYQDDFSLIDFGILRNTSIFNQYTEFDKGYIIKYCNEVLRNLFINIDTDKILPSVFTKMDYEKFIPNMKCAMEAGFSPDEMISIIVDDNFNLLSTNIEDAFANYQWLVNQKLLTTDIMREFFFDDFEIHTVQDLKKYYDINHKLPDLFNTLLVDKKDNEVQQELRDRLTYISTLELLGKDNKRLKKAKRMMSRNLFSSIVEQDKINIIRADRDYGDAWLTEFPSKYQELKGIYYPLYSKMRGINNTWFNSFFDSIDTPELKKFINSLDTIKNWDTYSSEIDRATDLKNEIVGRLLYADLLLKFGTYTGVISNASKLVNTYKKGGELENINIPFVDLLYVASKDKNTLFNLTPDFLISLEEELQENLGNTYRFAKTAGNQSRFIPYKKHIQMFSEAMLRIDPYSLITLKDVPIKLCQDREIDVKDYAHQYGYYIEGATDNNIQCFIEYINNDIKIPMLLKEDKKEYLDALRDSIHDYVSTQNIDKLYDICNMFDFYLRASKEFEIEKLQGNNFSQESKKIFDRTPDQDNSFDNMSRVLYCMFNLNRLSKHNYDWRVEKCDELRLNNSEERETFFNKIVPVRMQVDFLQEYGLSLTNIYHLYMAYENPNIFCTDAKSNRNSLQISAYIQAKMDKFDNLNLGDNMAITSYINRVTNDIENQNMRTAVQNYIQNGFYRLQSMTDAQEIKDEKRKLKREISILSNDNLSNLEEELKRRNCKSIPTSIKEKVELISAISNMFDFFKDYPTDYSILETAIYEEQVAYECKKNLANEAMQRFGILTSDGLVNAASLTAQAKKDRFSTLGYAVEVQKDDRGELILACYCKGITDSFSIHLKNLPAQVEETLKNLCNPAEYVIATTKISDRLRLSKIDTTNCDKNKPIVGFNSIIGLNEEQIQELRDNIAYKNAMTFGIVSTIDKNQSTVTESDKQVIPSNQSAVTVSAKQVIPSNQSAENESVAVDDKRERFFYPQEEYQSLIERPDEMLAENKGNEMSNSNIKHL